MVMKKNMKIKREEKEAPKPTKAERKKEAKSKLTKTGKIILVAIGVAAMLLSVTAMACSGILNQANSTEEYHLTGGVAATIDGTIITEDTVTKQIMSTRTSGGYDDDAAWASYLKGQGKTPESLREETIRSLAGNYLLSKAVKEYNITVSDDDVNESFENAASNYGGTEAMMSLLSQMGYTEDSYKEQIKSSLEQQKLKEEVAPEKEPTDDEVLTYFNDNVSTYNDARRSSNLLIKVDSDASDEDKEKAKATAQEALDKINSSELSFEDAVEEYSEDTGSKDDGGDVGWDKLTSFVTEYQDALSALSKDQISGIVETTYGYHIIKCTDYFHVDEKADSIDQIPTEIKDAIVSSLKSSQVDEDYSAWLEEYIDKNDLKINAMPADVPYNVDMNAADSSDADSSDDSSSDADANSGSAE